MQPLNPDQIETFLHRFHRGQDGQLRSVAIEMGRAGIATVTFTLDVPDAERDDDSLTQLRLQLAGVGEMRWQVRPTEDPQSLADGINIEVFNGQFFVDLLPWTDRPSGVHDYRVSSCYAAGAVVRWEIVE